MTDVSGLLLPHELHGGVDERGDADGAAAEPDAAREHVEALEAGGGFRDAPLLGLHPELHEERHKARVRPHQRDGELQRVEPDARHLQ